MRLLQRSLKRIANAATGGELDRLSNSLDGAYIRLKEQNREIQRAIDDAREGWIPLGGDQQIQNRQNMRDLSRQAFQRSDVFIKGALRLMTEFVFEQGIDGPISTDERAEVQVALDGFWNEDSNQEALFSTVAQHRGSNQLLVDGDYFAILRGGADTDKRTAVRFMPAAQVVDIIRDPFDLTRVLYYKCVVPQLKWDSTKNNWGTETDSKTAFYPDIFNIDPNNDPLKDRLKSHVEKDAHLLHIAINAIDAADFGWPEPAVSLPWFRRHREIAQDQATISKATGALMNVLKVDATAADMDTLRGDVESRSQWADSEANENVTGQFNLLNQQVELSVNRASSRAGEAETNSRMFRMGGAAGLNIPLHFQADLENANLATARSMDRPTLVHFRAYQSVWIDAYRKLIDFALLRLGIKDPQYDVPAPRIARQDISEAGKLIIDAYDAGLLTVNQSAASVLDMLGFDDIAKELAAREKEMETEEEAEVTPLEQEIIEGSSW